MREIKFRVWSFILGKMFSAEEMTEDQMALLPDGHFANIHSASVKLTRIFSHDEMLPMQFTGLRDKNGKEIYEGDVVLCDDKGECFPEKYNEENDEYYPVGKYQVIYSEDYPAFELKNSPCEDMNGLAYAHANSIEVVGNIYESPELLQGKEKQG